MDPQGSVINKAQFEGLDIFQMSNKLSKNRTAHEKLISAVFMNSPMLGTDLLGRCMERCSLWLFLPMSWA